MTRFSKKVLRNSKYFLALQREEITASRFPGSKESGRMSNTEKLQNGKSKERDGASNAAMRTPLIKANVIESTN